MLNNVERDRRNIEALKNDGWNVLIVWECELKKKVIEQTLARLIIEIKREDD